VSVPGVSFRLLLALTVFFADGLIVEAQPKNIENRPIDADSRCNRADSESLKLSFEFKSANF